MNKLTNWWDQKQNLFLLTNNTFFPQMTMSSLPLAFPASHAQIALRAKHADMPSWFLAQFMPSWFLTLFMPSWFLTLFMPSDIGKQCGLDRRKENWKRKNLCVTFPDISSSQCPMMSVHYVKFCASLGSKWSKPFTLTEKATLHGQGMIARNISAKAGI